MRCDHANCDAPVDRENEIGVLDVAAFYGAPKPAHPRPPNKRVEVGIKLTRIENKPGVMVLGCSGHRRESEQVARKENPGSAVFACFAGQAAQNSCQVNW